MARRKKIENDNDNNINSSPVITDDIDYYFIEFCNSHNIKDIYKMPSTQFVAALIYINSKYIKPNRILYTDALQGYKYNILSVDLLADRFIYMTYIYNQPLTLLNFSHFSGIAYKYIINWKYDDNSIVIDCSNSAYKNYIYNSNNADLQTGKGKVTISYKGIYEKLVNNTINIADMLANYKSGVNSIAWSNRIHDRYDNRKDNNKPVFDAISMAESLGISDKIQALETKKEQ